MLGYRRNCSYIYGEVKRQYCPVNAHSKGIENIDGKAPSFDWFTRIFTILFWPYQVYILVEGLFNHNA